MGSGAGEGDKDITQIYGFSAHKFQAKIETFFGRHV